MKKKKLLVSLFCMITFLTYSTAQFFYPSRKLSSRYSFTIFQDRQVTYSTNLVETHADYEDCITVCYNIFDRCKSIDIQIVNNSTLVCRFFNDDSPPTQLAEGYLFVSTVPPKCSQSCSLTLNPCGKCKCNPSCSAKNRRQHICNCTTAGVAKSCQEHYDNGFTKTGVFIIIPNGFPIETICEMDKVERKNPKINTQKCMLQTSTMMEFSFAFSVSYCAITCAKNKGIDTVIFNSPCFCGRYLGRTYLCPFFKACTYSDYCRIGESFDCTLTNLNRFELLIYENEVLISFDKNSCVNFCTNYQNTNSTYNGYVASGIAVTNNDCLCLYGFTGKTTSAYYGCLYYDMAPTTVVTSIKEVNEQLIQSSNLITTLSFLDKTFSVFFMLKPISNRGLMCNIIHMTTYGHYGYYGARIPGVWMDPSSRLYVSFAVNGDGDYAFYTQSLSLNVWSSLLISQTDFNGVYTYTVYLNDQIVRNNTNYQPQFFKDVKVYASDPWSCTFDGYIKDLKIVNGYADFVDEVSELVIKKNNLIALLSYLDEAYSVSFKIKPRSYSLGWKSVIHLTIGKDVGNYGDRTPAVFFNSDRSGRLYITSAVSGNSNHIFITQPLPLNEWTSIQILQIQLKGKYVFSVYLNELIVHSVENTKPQSFENLKVYAADPWYDAQDCSIKDLKVISGSNGVWIPMMTRFASWESSFWDKSYESYENGFGLVNQQWIGLKNLNQITSNYFTDMRIDYVFKEGITFSTRYYNVTIGSSEEKYIFQYEKYNPRGSGEPDRLNTNGMVFNNCSNWWTAIGQNNVNCNKDMFPTSTNYICFGSAKELLSIQFFLRTNLEKETTNAP
ncbi:uncharacterized protein LOC105846093 isoform X2 [Hydra vulgaris]|uniref:uncharacterized protein LOC105846093 isoform X2 n=1 Tax=Hydra vulgaris TaxID=6087 RepID=UPI001F5F99AA|nr:uncharacterized protein LOC105846093 isoform X2 [Hydra vulgaris]